MSFEKAQQLLELATFVAAWRMGVTLDEVSDRRIFLGEPHNAYYKPLWIGGQGIGAPKFRGM
jgi:hypothetical protein